MKYPHLATRIYNCGLLLAPGKAELIERAFRAYDEGLPALLAPTTDPPKVRTMMTGSVRADAGYERTKQGVAIIQMVGPLVQRGGMNFMSGGPTGYNEVAAELQAALDDQRVDAILIEIDSPGGEANGAFDLQAKIRAAAQKKPTWAIANEQAFSAAYLQASGAGRLFVPEPGMVGSVGVVMLHVDQSQRDARAGLVYTPIFAGARKVDFSSHAPLSEDAMAIAQVEVDRLHSILVEAVAQGRGIDPQAVRDTEAALLSPRDALDRGFIDGIQGFDETLAQLAAEGQHVRIHGMRAAGSARAAAPAQPDPLSLSEGDSTMMTDQERAAQAALIAEARAAGVTEGKTAAEADAAKKLAEAQAVASTAAAEAATARIKAITQCEEAKQRPALAAHLAYETKMTPDEAKALLAKAAIEIDAKGGGLAARMAHVPNPKTGVDGGQNEGAGVVISADAVFASRRKASGRVA